MTKRIEKFSNNVFDLRSLTVKEFKEIIQNFINTINLLKPDEVELLDSDELLERLKEFGIVTINQNQNTIQSILGTDIYRELLFSVSKLVDPQINTVADVLKYSLTYRMNVQSTKEYRGTVIDLFCGSGGLSLGFHKNGFEILFANDIERSALRTYQFNHPSFNSSNMVCGPIEDINVQDFVSSDVDVIIGGPPCQGFSMANRQRIIDDPRNKLYKYFVNAIKQFKPKFFIMENVKGMLKVANQVVQDINSEDEEYDVEFRVFNMRMFGVPQNRERLIYVGVRKDISHNQVTALEIIQHLKSYETQDSTLLLDALVNLRSLEALTVKNSTELDSIESGKKIDALTVCAANSYLDKINSGYPKNNLVYNHKARYNNSRDIEIYSRLKEGEDSTSDSIKDIMPYKSRQHIFKDKYYKLDSKNVSKTITAHMKFDCNMYIHPFEARGLTPREAARIQSYPDSYFFLGTFTKTYMLIGNSVPPLFSNYISEVISKNL